MTPLLAELRAMTDDQLVADHDREARHAVTSVNCYLGESARRDQDRHAQAMMRHTRWMTVMTVIPLDSNGRDGRQREIRRSGPLPC